MISDIHNHVCINQGLQASHLGASYLNLPGGLEDKASTCNAGDLGSIPELGRSGERKWQPTPVLLPGKSHRRRSLVGDSPWGHKESDVTSLSLSLDKCAALQPLGTTVPVSSLPSHLPCCCTSLPISASCADLCPWPPRPPPSSPAAGTTTALIQGVKRGSEGE